jgi:hypothetical protein
LTRSRRRWGLLARDSDAPPTAVPRLRSAPLPVRLGILAVATNLVPPVLPLSLPLAAAAVAVGLVTRRREAPHGGQPARDAAAGAALGESG